MSYDLHITKAPDQSESSSGTISVDQWLALVQADGELTMDTSASAVNPKTREIIQVQNPLMASWADPDTRIKHYFYYSRGAITVKNPPDALIRKMKAVASKLGAKVRGDEGELY